MTAIPTAIKATGSHFYRYQGATHLDRLKPVILDHLLYLPLVSQLNDPADGRPKLAPLTAQEMLRFLYTPASNPTCTAAAQKTIVNMLSSHIKLYSPEALLRKASELLNRHVEKYRVLSLSKRFDNLSLWAKYAGDHTGYCLEFANEGLFSRAVEVIYGDSIPMDVNNPDHRKSYFFFCKRNEWSNEEEIRVIFMPGAPATVEIDPRWLTRIILGKSMSPENQAQIRQWAKSRQPELVVVQAFFDNLRQEIRLE